MSAEAEKVISLSLCKMAESRTTRRGGTSLHKHLLIASVLTKATRARSAILDTWYMGDDTTEGNVDLNMSYQEADFPGDELDSNVGESSELDIDPSIVTSAMDPLNNNDVSTTRDSENDPRYAAEVESEIDLPPDILNCVEKLGDLNERIFSSAQPSISTASDESVPTSKTTTCPLYVPTTQSIPDVIAAPQSSTINADAGDNIHDSTDSHISNTLTYLDLDAGSSTVVECGPKHTSTPAKRRREWCFEDDDDDDDEEETEICRTSGSFYIKTPVKSEFAVKSSENGFGKNCKRLRFDDSGVSSPEKTIDDETGVPSQRATCNEEPFKAGTFRLTYEDVDADDSDDDSFLEDALSQGLQTPSQIQMAKTRHRNDRRVPSASSSGSCSDEDGEEGEGSMEVDQITNLVQFISFNKQQSQAQNAANLRSISCAN